MKRRTPRSATRREIPRRASALDAHKKKSRRRRSLKVAGLFAGVGGLELGLGMAGHVTQLLCEVDDAARNVLIARFPNVPLHADVCDLPSLPNDIDLVAAGFPCQDLSQAGKTAGINGSKSGVVAHVFRLLEQRPVRWLLIENVPFMLKLNRGRAMTYVTRSLEQLGYRWAYRVVDSHAFGLPQRRARVFLLASLDDDPRRVILADDAGKPDDASRRNSVACGFYWTEGNTGLGWAVNAVPPLKGGSLFGIPCPPAILMPNRTIIQPDIRDAERLQGFKPNWTKPAGDGHRTFRWKLIGNAVTVHVARWIGQRISHPRVYRGESDQPLGRDDSWPAAAWNLGDGTFAAQVSSWPVQYKSRPLSEFLRYPGRPLSKRATAGFLSRIKASTLRSPSGFIDAVEAHLDLMKRAK